MRGLFEEYLAANADLMAFYASAPQALFQSAPQAVPWDPGLVEALRQYNTRLGAPKAFTGQEAVIITGQQPGLFTGPLYTIYKAITAIRAARQLETESGVPCVPIFWVGSEDHDFEEVRSAVFLTKSHEPLSLTYEPASPVGGRPMYNVPLGDSLHALIDEALAVTRGSVCREEVADLLRNTLNQSRSLAGWTTRILAHLFRDTPLVLFAPHLPMARTLAKDILQQAITQPLATTRLLNNAGKELEALGFSPQLVKGETECAFFLELGDRRRKVLFENDRFSLPEENIHCTTESMQTLLDASPEQFSPNVALRCIVQQHLFPVAAYVAGPGEIAYWGQLKSVFEHFGHTMPIVYPRARCTLTSHKVSALLAQYDFSITDFTTDRDTLLKRALEHVVQNPARNTLEVGRHPIEAALTQLARELSLHEATASAMLMRLQKHVHAGFDRIERAVLHADETQLEATRNQVARLCNTLAPFRKPQERVYTIASFLFEHGWGLVPRLQKALDIESFEMNEVEL